MSSYSSYYSPPSYQRPSTTTSGHTSIYGSPVAGQQGQFINKMPGKMPHAMAAQPATQRPVYGAGVMPTPRRVSGGAAVPGGSNVTGGPSVYQGWSPGWRPLPGRRGSRYNSWLSLLGQNQPYGNGLRYGMQSYGPGGMPRMVSYGTG